MYDIIIYYKYLLKMKNLNNKDRAGFTLMEIMIVVVIIGLLAAMMIPMFNKARVNSYNSRLLNDYRVFSAAFTFYELKNGVYPPASNAAEIPTGMADYLPNTWLDTPLNGAWEWDYNESGITAGVSLRNSNATDEQMIIIDSKLDDGVLSTGMFRKLTNDRFTYILVL